MSEKKTNREIYDEMINLTTNLSKDDSEQVFVDYLSDLRDASNHDYDNFVKYLSTLKKGGYKKKTKKTKQNKTKQKKTKKTKKRRPTRKRKMT
jgi:hypothetical protein